MKVRNNSQKLHASTAAAVGATVNVFSFLKGIAYVSCEQKTYCCVNVVASQSCAMC
jgi:hypothetical protein